MLTAPGIKMKMQNDGVRPRIPNLRPHKSTEELEFLMMVELFGEISAYAENQGVFVVIEPLNRYEQFFPQSLADGVRGAARGTARCRRQRERAEEKRGTERRG